MPINLQIRWDLSLAKLVQLHRAGEVVFKTPHVGNWYANNLACGQIGLPMKVVDGTKGCLDKNFHPHCVIVKGERHVVANDDVLTAHAVVETTPPVLSDRFVPGGSTSDIHMQALRDAIPDIEAFTLTEYFHKNVDRVLALLEVLTKEDPTIWERYVFDDGHTQNRRLRRGWAELQGSGICGTNGSRRGWVSSNIANILMDVTIDPATHGTDTVYELSGPDMYRYVGDLMPRLNHFYEVARRALPWNLPETVTLNLVPVADMRFAVPQKKRAALDTLVDTWHRLRGFEGGIGARLKGAPNKPEAIQSIQTQRFGINADLRDAMRECPDPFYNIYDGSYFSQYDLLHEEAPLYVHPWALEAPMSELASTVRSLSRLAA